MFLEFYGLREQPFGVTPDPRFLYLSPTHREALASLMVGLRTGQGFLALIARPGMGKTSLLSRLLQGLKSSARTVLLFQTQCDSRELLRYILDDMGIPCSGLDLVEMHNQLNHALVESARGGKQFILIIDEAQNLDRSVLETVRLLSDFETPKSKLMQIVLTGQPQLAEKLALPALAQLRQRISVLSRLEPLTPEETSLYIQHRLAVAGHPNSRLFTAAAVKLIARHSCGIPRNINTLCFNALSWGCAVKMRRVDEGIIQQVAEELAVDRLAPGAEASPVRTSRHPSGADFLTTLSFTRSGRGNWVRRVAVAATIAVLVSLGSYFTRGGRATVTSLPSVTARAPELADAYPNPPAAPPATEQITAPAASVPETSGRTNKPEDGEALKTIVVEPGETLWEICRRYLRHQGNRELVERIRALNPPLADTDHIEAGMSIQIPPAERASTAAGRASAAPTAGAAQEASRP